MSQALRGWVDFVMIRQQLRHRINVAVARWHYAKLARGLNTWRHTVAALLYEEQAARNKQARMRGIMHRIQHRSLSKCMVRWHESMRQSRLMRRFSKRIMHLHMSQALRGWVDFVMIRQQLRHRINVAVARWYYAKLARGLNTWRQTVAALLHEEQAARNKQARMRGIIHRIQHRSLSKCMVRWHDYVCEIRVFKRYALRVMCLTLSRAFRGWLYYFKWNNDCLRQFRSVLRCREISFLS